jgi:hypothetical protein
MKGVVFTELVGFLEARYGTAFADTVLEAANLPNQGGFTSVGNYSSALALQIIETAADMAHETHADFCADYGSYLYARLAQQFPTIVGAYGTAEAMLAHISSHIHAEVSILYPDARPPRVTTQVDGDSTIVHYESHRPLAHLAFGLIRQCLVAFGDTRQPVWLDDNSSYQASFALVAVPVAARKVELA